MRKKVNGHLRKIALLGLNYFLNREYFFKSIGWFNQRFDFLHSIFVAYPASEEYALAYVYPRHRNKMRWQPWPVGVFRQNGKWGIMMVISSIEKDFNNPDNVGELRDLVTRTEHIKYLTNASQKTFAGILPGVLFFNQIIRDTIEADVTVDAVLKAEKQVRDELHYPEETPLIILGGKGFIGRRVVKKLNHREVYCVDLNHREIDLSLWPSHLEKRQSILVNLTKRSALTHYLELFWPQLVLLNETYPEPTEIEISSLTKIGSPVFHVVGVAAFSVPPFPKAYKGGIPCCAARISEKMKVLVKRLN